MKRVKETALADPVTTVLLGALGIIVGTLGTLVVTLLVDPMGRLGKLEDEVSKLKGSVEATKSSVTNIVDEGVAHSHAIFRARVDELRRLRTLDYNYQNFSWFRIDGLPIPRCIELFSGVSRDFAERTYKKTCDDLEQELYAPPSASPPHPTQPAPQGSATP